MADEAQAYLRQEAQHSAAHLSHIRALTRRWPGLRATSDAVIASYDRLVATKPLAWRLAYPAIVEATFTPYFKVLLDHEDKLFEPGDERVASMFIWHFCEEIEHRSSALRVYDARGRGLRVRREGHRRCRQAHGRDSRHHFRWIPGARTAGGRGDFGRLIPKGLSLKAFRESHQAAREYGNYRSTYAGVPRREILSMLTGLVRSQGPTTIPRTKDSPSSPGGGWANTRRIRRSPRTGIRWACAAPDRVDLTGRRWGHRGSPGGCNPGMPAT